MSTANQRRFVAMTRHYKQQAVHRKLQFGYKFTLKSSNKFSLFTNIDTQIYLVHTHIVLTVFFRRKLDLYRRPVWFSPSIRYEREPL